jgi:small-conductance mechanosensitive channel
MDISIDVKTPLEWLGKFFGHFPVEGFEKLLIQGIKAVLVLVLAYLFLRFLLRFIDRYLSSDDGTEDNYILTYKVISRYFVWTLAIAIVVHIAGINLTSFFTTGGLLAIGAGFALKNIAENYVAGLVLRAEETVKHGDVLEIDGMFVRVKSIGLRSTIARAANDADLMIPNSKFVQEKFTNYTLRDSICRISTTIGVSYSSDLKKVREVLETTCRNLEGLSSRRPSQVYLNDFGSSSVNYHVFVWIEDPWSNYRVATSNLNEAIWWALKDASIVIAFPQLDLHFDENFRQPGNFTKQEPEH